MRLINMLVIHCSASPNGKRVTSEEIDAWHAARGFRRDPALIGPNEPTLKHIGYHYVIYVEGLVRIGRGEGEVGAHAEGYNAHSIGICMVGTDRFTTAQWNNLATLVDRIQKRYSTIREVVGHRDLSVDLNGDGVIEPNEWMKTCPGFNVSSWLSRGMKPEPEHVL